MKSQVNDSYKRIIRHMSAATLFVAVFVVILFAYASYLSNKDMKIDLGTDGKNYRFTYNISKDWSERAHGYKIGEQIDIEIENKTDITIKDWVIKIYLVEGSKIDSSWNGEFLYDEALGELTITCLDFNDTVTPGEVQPFGMVLYSPSKFAVEQGYMTYRQERKITDLWLFWVMVVVYGVAIITSIDSWIYSAKNNALRRKQKEAYRIINQSFITFAGTIDAKDSYTKGHSQRVAYYAREIARRMGCDEDFCRNIFYVGLLHDIGKIGVQDAILKKNAKLTYDEFNEIKEHVSMGGDILKNFTAVPGIEDGARYHHEKYDGTGYMEGLKGEEIPFLARIITVADSFDAMSSARCYRAAMDKQEIIAELNRCVGSQFDPRIVPHIIDMINEGVAPIEFKEGELEKELEMIN